MNSALNRANTAIHRRIPCVASVGPRSWPRCPSSLAMLAFSRCIPNAAGAGVAHALARAYASARPPRNRQENVNTQDAVMLAKRAAEAVKLGARSSRGVASSGDAVFPNHPRSLEFAGEKHLRMLQTPAWVGQMLRSCAVLGGNSGLHIGDADIKLLFASMESRHAHAVARLQVATANLIQHNRMSDAIAVSALMACYRVMAESTHSRDQLLLVAETVIQQVLTKNDMKTEVPLAKYVRVLGIAGKPQQAIDSVQFLVQKGIFPSIFYLNDVMKACIDAGRFDKLLEVYCALDEFDAVPHITTRKILLFGLHRALDVQHAVPEGALNIVPTKSLFSDLSEAEKPTVGNVYTVDSYLQLLLEAHDDKGHPVARAEMMQLALKFLVNYCPYDSDGLRFAAMWSRDVKFSRLRALMKDEEVMKVMAGGEANFRYCTDLVTLAALRMKDSKRTASEDPTFNAAEAQDKMDLLTGPMRKEQLLHIARERAAAGDDRMLQQVRKAAAPEVALAAAVEALAAARSGAVLATLDHRSLADMMTNSISVGAAQVAFSDDFREVSPMIGSKMSVKASKNGIGAQPIASGVPPLPSSHAESVSSHEHTSSFAAENIQLSLTDGRVERIVNDRACYILQEVRKKLIQVMEDTPDNIRVRSALIHRAETALRIMQAQGVDASVDTVGTYLSIVIVSGFPHKLRVARPFLGAVPSSAAAKHFTDVLARHCNEATASTILRMVPDLVQFGVRPSAATLDWLSEQATQRWLRVHVDSCPGCMSDGGARDEIPMVAGNVHTGGGASKRPTATVAMAARSFSTDSAVPLYASPFAAARLADNVSAVSKSLLFGEASRDLSTRENESARTSLSVADRRNKLLALIANSRRTPSRVQCAATNSNPSLTSSADFALFPSQQLRLFESLGLLHQLDEQTFIRLALAAASRPCGREAWEVWSMMRRLGLPSAHHPKVLHHMLSAFVDAGLQVGAWEVYSLLFPTNRGPLPSLTQLRKVLNSEPLATGASASPIVSQVSSNGPVPSEVPPPAPSSAAKSDVSLSILGHCCASRPPIVLRELFSVFGADSTLSDAKSGVTTLSDAARAEYTWRYINVPFAAIAGPRYSAGLLQLSVLHKCHVSFLRHFAKLLPDIMQAGACPPEVALDVMIASGPRLSVPRKLLKSPPVCSAADGVPVLVDLSKDPETATEQFVDVLSCHLCVGIPRKGGQDWARLHDIVPHLQAACAARAVHSMWTLPLDGLNLALKSREPSDEYIKAVEQLWLKKYSSRAPVAPPIVCAGASAERLMKVPGTCRVGDADHEVAVRCMLPSGEMVFVCQSPLGEVHATSDNELQSDMITAVLSRAAASLCPAPQTGSFLGFVRSSPTAGYVTLGCHHVHEQYGMLGMASAARPSFHGKEAFHCITALKAAESLVPFVATLSCVVTATRSTLQPLVCVESLRPIGEEVTNAAVAAPVAVLQLPASTAAVITSHKVVPMLLSALSPFLPQRIERSTCALVQHHWHLTQTPAVAFLRPHNLTVISALRSPVNSSVHADTRDPLVDAAIVQMVTTYPSSTDDALRKRMMEVNRQLAQACAAGLCSPSAGLLLELSHFNKRFVVAGKLKQVSTETLHWLDDTMAGPGTSGAIETSADPIPPRDGQLSQRTLMTIWVPKNSLVTGSFAAGMSACLSEVAAREFPGATITCRLNSSVETATSGETSACRVASRTERKRITQAATPRQQVGRVALDGSISAQGFDQLRLLLNNKASVLFLQQGERSIPVLLQRSSEKY